MVLAGFGNVHATEAIPNALPRDQNSPQHCPLGLYAEQLSGTAFTQSRHQNQHSWLYRILPSVARHDFEPCALNIEQPLATLQSPNPMRWSRLSRVSKSQDFIEGLFHVAGNSSLNTYIYQCNLSMHRYFYNHDGELLFVPYAGDIRLHTELGQMTVSVGMIAVIPRGIWFRVELLSKEAAGYLCENFGLPLRLPQLGILGANGLANPRHFLYPNAAVETIDGPVELICKYQHHLWQSINSHSPLNVVAWYGSYAPYTYDLSLFNTLGSISFDHPDPSIYTVLSSDSHFQGTANLDFVIFPERWMVAEHTFRPPYFHRNVMSELMGLIRGSYDAKDEGFSIGGFSIHNQMTAHGPDVNSTQQAFTGIQTPEKYTDTLAFMFESREPWLITEAALNHPNRDTRYSDCWQGLPIRFNQK